MDARDRLRRYLEQRREAGETELVFDSLAVDEAMRILGAGARDHAGRDRPGERTGRDRAPAPPPLPGPGHAEWRDVLREAGAGPSAGEPAPSPDQPKPAPPPAAAPAAPEALATIPLDRIPTGIVIGGPGKELFANGSPFSTLKDIADAVASCTRCALYRDAKHPVPGEGNANAKLVCVGEAPGATEDELGRPFVGQAGQLLEKILAAIGLARSDVYICNVLKHRPPGNRNPMPDEVEACSPYLVRQIELIQPRVIVALGTFAAQTLLNTRDGIGKLRGKIHRYHSVPLVVTYHPAALLRNPAWKRPTWDDVQLAKRLLDRAHP